MTIRELFVSIGFDVDDKAIKELDKGITHLKTGILAIGGTVAAAGASLFLLARNVANIGDTARETAQSLGLTTEAVQELQYAGELSGVGQEEMNTTLKFLAKNASEAKDGVKNYSDEFKKLGVKVTNANGELKNSDILLMDMADAISKLPDGANKTAIAVNLLGRSGHKLIPFLNDGSKGIAALRAEAQEFGAVVSDDAAKASDEFNDSITKLMWAIRGIKIAIGQGLIPQLTEMIIYAKEWIKQNNVLIQQKLVRAVNFIVTGLKIMFSVIKYGLNILDKLINYFGGLERVLKFTAYAFGFLLSMKLIFGLGLIAKAVGVIILAIKSMGAVALIAQAKMLLMPLLVGAAVVALGLIIEDIIAFFQGRNSLTGVIVDAFEKKFPEAFAIARNIFEGLKTAILTTIEFIKNLYASIDWSSVFETMKISAETALNFIVALFMSLVNVIKNTGELIGGLVFAIIENLKGLGLALQGVFTLDLDKIKSGLELIKESFIVIFESIYTAVTGIFGELFNYIFGGFDEKISGMVDKIKNIFGFGNNNTNADAINSISSANPTSSPVANTTNNKSVVNAQKINAPITVNVPQGTPPDQVSSAVHGGVKDALSSLLRETAIATEPQVIY